ncbi:MAG: T9SS type A sorting domain-containing protein [Bacteroidota bacterium]|nr:T9SS type A sorting domain-containing protein [Bacteroidota bacterium]
MRKFYYYLLYTIYILIIPSNSLTQWVHLNGPYWESISSLTANGSYLFAGSMYSGVLLSTDNGITWVQMNNGLNYWQIFSLCNCNSNVFAATKGGVYKTANDGTPWQLVNNGLSGYVNTLTANGNNIYAINESDIFKSSNNGELWTHINIGFPNIGAIRAISVLDSLIILGTSNGLFRSTNLGETWTALNLHYEVTAVTLCDTGIIAGTNNNGIFLSTDNGASWVQATTCSGVNCFYSSGDNIYAGTKAGILLSSNHGLGWNYIGEEPGNVSSIIADGSEIYAANEDGFGIYKTTNNGTTWSQANDGLFLTQIRTLDALGNYLYAATYGNGIIASSNNGLNWIKVNNGIPSRFTLSLGVKGNNLFTGTWAYTDDPAGIFLSTDHGAEWVNISNGINQGAMISCFAFKENKIFAGTYETDGHREWGYIYLSTNDGESWSNVFNNVFPDCIQTLFINNNHIYAGTFWGYALRSRVDSISWNRIYDLGMASRVSSFCAIGNTILAVTDYDGICRSTDDGNTWQKSGANIAAITFTKYKNNIFAGSYNGIYFSADTGRIWQRIDDGFGGSPVFCLVIKGDYIYAGTYGTGIWRRLLSEIFTPVELSSFTAAYEDNSCLLNWNTATETNNRGFDVERKYGNENWIKIGFVHGKGTTTERTDYQYADNLSDLSYTGTISYRLRQIDYDSKYSYSSEVNINADLAPKTYSLSQNYPNPFNPSTVIKYAVPIESNVNIKFYNALGQVVREVNEGLKQPGNYEYIFSCAGLSSGIYFYSLKAASTDGKKDFSAVKKMVIIK